MEAEADDEDAADAAEDALEHGEGAAEVGAAHLHREDRGRHDPVTDPHQDPDTHWMRHASDVLQFTVGSHSYSKLI